MKQMNLEDLEQERLNVGKTVEKKSVTKKATEKKETAAKAVSTAAVEEKAAETKAQEKKAETKSAKKTETKKTDKKETEKKEAEPKAAKTSRAKAKPVEKITLQVNGRSDLAMENLIDRVKAAYVAEGHSADSIQNVEVYIKLDENMAYYVIDGYASGISLY